MWLLLSNLIDFGKLRKGGNLKKTLRVGESKSGICQKDFATCEKYCGFDWDEKKGMNVETLDYYGDLVKVVR